MYQLYCGGAIIGCVHTKTVTAKNCWRNPEMILTDFVGAYTDAYNYNNVLVDTDDVINGVPPIIAGLADDVTNAFAQRPYHGKAVYYIYNI